MLRILRDQMANKAEISGLLGQKGFRSAEQSRCQDLLAAELIAYTIPEKPNSRLQNTG